MPCPRAASMQAARPSSSVAARQRPTPPLARGGRRSLHNTVEAVIKQESAEESTALSRASSRTSEAPGGHAFQGGSQHGIPARSPAAQIPGRQGRLPRDEHGAEQQSGHADAAAVTALRVSLALRIRPKSMGQTT